MQTLERVKKYDARNRKQGARNTQLYWCVGVNVALTPRQHKRVQKQSARAMAWERRIIGQGLSVLVFSMPGWSLASG